MRLILHHGVLPEELIDIVARTIRSAEVVTNNHYVVTDIKEVAEHRDDFDTLEESQRAQYRIMAGAVLNRLTPLLNLYTAYSGMDGKWRVANITDGSDVLMLHEEDKDAAIRRAAKANRITLRRAQLIS